MPHYATWQDWEARKQHLRRQILSAAGLYPMPHRAPLRAQISSRLDREGYSVEKVFLETLPGYYLGGNLYRPRGRAGRLPGVLSPHGHWRKGRLEDSELVSEPGRAINLARQGYVVFSYDMAGYNDTRQTRHEFGSRAYDLWSFHTLGLQLWNSIRSLDFLESLPDVDPTRLAGTGASGGATQLLLLAAVDDRVSADVPVNMISSSMQGDSACENAPGLRHDTFNVEFCAMMAPRPMLVVSATGDWTNHFPAVEFPAIQAIYQLYGAADSLRQVQFDAPHNYHRGSREAMYTFFGKILQSATTTVREEPFFVEDPSNLLVWPEQERPGNAAAMDRVFGAWRRLTATAFLTSSTSTQRECLRYALSAEQPSHVDAETHGELVSLSRPTHGDRLTGIFHPGTGDPLLVIHPHGAETARKLVPHRGRSVFYLNPFPNSGRHLLTWRFYTTYHRTDSQNRVQDILTAAAWLRHLTGRAVQVQGFENAAVWATFAAAVDPDVRLRGPLPAFGGTDADFLRGFFVPGIRRAGGWETAGRLTRGRRTTAEESE